MTPRVLINNTWIWHRARSEATSNIAGTMRVGYYFLGPKPLTPGVVEINRASKQRCFQQSSIAFGARAALFTHYSERSGGCNPIPSTSGFIGGSDTVRSFGYRDLGRMTEKITPSARIFTVLTSIYVPIFGEYRARFSQTGQSASDIRRTRPRRHALCCGRRVAL